MIIWILGSGGLFGSALVRESKRAGLTVFNADPIPWTDPLTARSVIRMNAARFFRESPKYDNFSIVWAAGHATTSSTQPEIDIELSLFSVALEDIAGMTPAASNGSFLLASSAGGIYAGSPDPPFSSETKPQPVGAYGFLKLKQETAAIQALAGHMKVVLARLGNLYGPGQDLSKLQGLVSRLALSSITREPLTMYVPLETLRDFIYADDAARNAIDFILTSQEDPMIRVIASGNAVSLGHVIRSMKNVTHKSLPIAYGYHPTAAAQALDLRLAPDNLGQGQTRAPTPLPAGMKMVHEDLLERHRFHVDLKS